MEADWLITAIQDRGPGNYYRYRVEGENLSARPIDRFFCWRVRDIQDERFAPHPKAAPQVVAAIHAAKSVAAQ